MDKIFNLDTEPLGYQPLFFEEEILEREQLQTADNWQKGYGDTDNDIFNPEKKINISKKKKPKPKDVFAEIRELRKPSKKKKRVVPNINISNQPKQTILDNPRGHHDGGWNIDTRTTGLFDADLKKNEVTGPMKKRTLKVNRKVPESKPRKKKMDSEPLLSEQKVTLSLNLYQDSTKQVYFTDLKEVEDMLYDQDHKNAKYMSKVNKEKLAKLKEELKRQQAENNSQQTKFIKSVNLLAEGSKKKAFNDAFKSGQVPPRKWESDQQYKSKIIKNKVEGRLRHFDKIENEFERMERLVEQEEDLKQVIANNKVSWSDQITMMQDAIRPPTSALKRPHHPQSKAGDQKSIKVQEIHKADNEHGEKIIEVDPRAPKHHSDNLVKFDDLSNQLTSIRHALQPLLSQYLSPTGSSHAELLEAAAGRLLHQNSSALIELIVEELLKEQVIELNEIEAARKRFSIKVEQKHLLKRMISEFGNMDVEGRLFIAEPKIINKPAPQLLLPQTDSHAAQARKSPLNKFREEFGLESCAPTPVELDPYLMMKIIRDQVMHEDAVNAIPYMTLQYTKRVSIISEELIAEELNRILEEFAKAQDEFLNEVIKSELR